MGLYTDKAKECRSPRPSREQPAGPPRRCAIPVPKLDTPEHFLIKRLLSVQLFMGTVTPTAVLQSRKYYHLSSAQKKMEVELLPRVTELMRGGASMPGHTFWVQRTFHSALLPFL